MARAFLAGHLNNGRHASYRSLSKVRKLSVLVARCSSKNLDNSLVGFSWLSGKTFSHA